MSRWMEDDMDGEDRMLTTAAESGREEQEENELTGPAAEMALMDGARPGTAGLLSDADVMERLFTMLRAERSCMPRPDYVEAVQRDGMRVMWRTKVASWLLEFEEAYGVSQETIAVAVNYMDRYLSVTSTKKSILQLLAMAAIFAATKLHEEAPLGIRELRDLAVGAYLESDIRLMELELLRVVQWKLSPVTPQACAAHLAHLIPCPAWRAAAEEDAVTFLEVAIPEYEFLRFAPSEQAAAALLCSFDMIGMDPAVAHAWAAAVAPLGVLASPRVFECKARMLAIFDSLVPQRAPGASGVPGADAAAGAPPQLGVECPSPDARAARVVSPTGVDELGFGGHAGPDGEERDAYDAYDVDDVEAGGAWHGVTFGGEAPGAAGSDGAPARRAKASSPFQAIDGAAPLGGGLGAALAAPRPWQRGGGGDAHAR